MHIDPSPTAALKASKEHRPRYAWSRGSTQPDAGKGADQANHFVGVGSSAPTGEPSNLTAGAGTPNARPFLGPLTTNRMDGAGGPHNPWDCKIAAAHRRGNHLLAQRLQSARARINLAFGLLEPVWIPTDSQRAMFGLLSCPTGLRILDAA